MFPLRTGNPQKTKAKTHEEELPQYFSSAPVYIRRDKCQKQIKGRLTRTN
ncbi:hypothetical protein ACPOL_1991 [Acidisarcina polymorpha]|uniref:Uncharacterized protein n=1 Tax=Acidisarcina polymorpha TaxID=2211140 RepID=A0A2Z5FXY1_9BACT|nr:hypothetical protein ACPOL_1991 [Acidisarcina polymorpha]